MPGTYQEAYSSGDCSGFAPDSLFRRIPPDAPPVAAIKVAFLQLFSIVIAAAPQEIKVTI